MTEFTLDSAHTIADEKALRALYPATHDLAAIKSKPYLDKHAQAFVRRAPFVCIGTQDRDGRADVSPRGDPVGFVKILDAQTLAIPDRPGNNRLDTLANITHNPQVGLLFMVPGFDETLRVNGHARLTRDPALLADLAVNDRAPTLAIVVTVAESFLHCAKAFRRARLWDPASRQDRAEMPSLMAILMDQTDEGAPTDAEEMASLDASLEEAYRTSMY